MADTTRGGVRPKHGKTAQQPANPPAEEQEEGRANLEETNGDVTEGARNYIWTREGGRRIKLHSRRKIAASVDDAVVKTTGGAPDMRFAENRLGFMADPSKKKSGEDDFRFLENRPDILAIHEQRGETFPNLLFDEDGAVRNAGEEVVGAIGEE